jgi:adhesin/invasin
MLACRFRSSLAATALVAAAIFSASCEKVPLVAPTGSTITLNAGTTVLSANGSTTITATLIEAAGTAPHSGTHITLLTTLGKLTPSTVETNAAGVATVTFSGNGSNGTAIISATSGGATTGSAGALQIALGSAAAGQVTLNANPSSLPSAGGTSTVTAIVLDVNGNALVGTPVAFSTSAGSLSTGLVTTDASGFASTSVTTSQQTTITASVGATASSGGTGGTGGTGTTPPTAGPKTATVQIGITATPTIGITPPTSVSRGVPASFTFVVTPAAQNANAVKNVSVNWGDGGPTQNLGSFSGSQAVSHVFNSEGTFNITATVTDVGGGTNQTATSVVAVPLPKPSININYSPIPAKVNTLTTILLQITPPAGIGITGVTVDFGDGTTADLGGGGNNAPHVYTSQGTFTVTVTVTDTAGQTTVGRGSVSIGP